MPTINRNSLLPKHFNHAPLWLAVILVLLFKLPSAMADQPDQRPNILIIFIDDMGWRDVGFMGSDFYETPQLDRLAKQGMVFNQAYSCAANCAPARACLLSGQYSPRHKLYNVGTTARGKKQHRRLKHIPGTDTLDPGITTWARRIQAAGYKTASMGKWHLSTDPRPYGFDINIGGSHSGSPPRGYYPPHPKAPGLENSPADEYLTDRLSDEACQFIETNRDQPWLLYLTHFAIHTPLNAKQELVQKYEDKPAGKLHQHVAMATMIQSVDDGVARIVATLDRLNLRDNTVIIFYSDNGGYGPATDMKPLKGYKGTYYEGGIRVPFFACWPDKIKPGTSSEPIIGTDLYPTLCEIAGVDIQDDQIMDGNSLMPVLTGQRATVSPDGSARPLYWHFPAYLQSYGGRNGTVAEQRDPLFRSRPCSAIRLGDWKLIQYFESGDLELFNLSQDIGETTNLVGKHPEQVDALFNRLQRWQQETGADIPTELNPDFDGDEEARARAKAVKK